MGWSWSYPGGHTQVVIPRLSYPCCHTQVVKVVIPRWSRWSYPGGHPPRYTLHWHCPTSLCTSAKFLRLPHLQSSRNSMYICRISSFTSSSSISQAIAKRRLGGVRRASISISSSRMRLVRVARRIPVAPVESGLLHVPSHGIVTISWSFLLMIIDGNESMSESSTEGPLHPILVFGSNSLHVEYNWRTMSPYLLGCMQASQLG